MGRSAPYITRLLKGDHNLTIRTLARALGACGYEVEFQTVPLKWNWVDDRPLDSDSKKVTGSSALDSGVPRATEMDFPLAA
jgi:hypothetical protein